MNPGETGPEDLLARTRWTCSKQNTESEKFLKSDMQSYERSKANKINFYFLTLHDTSILRSGPQARHKMIHIFVKIIPSIKLQ